MWVADAKDNYVVRQIIEIAGKDRIDAAEARGEAKGEAMGIRIGIARSLVRHAMRRGIALPAAPPETEASLAAHVEPAMLDRMLDDVDAMTHFDAFVERHLGKAIAWTRS